MTLSLMYGLKNIDFFELESSITSADVYPFLIVFAVLLPAFILVERRATDPIMNLSYFSNPNILIALICSVISGIIMMGTIFFPQFAENSLFLKSGAGGYFIMILGLGSGFGAMLSGKLIDRFGVKPVLGAGFVGSLAGALFMALVACNNPTLFNVCAMLALTGAGLGFTMGTPLNYMMLQNTADEESNSALATMSLVRSIGTAVAPAIMVAFVAHAGLSMQDNIMSVLPDEVSVSPLPYAEELDAKIVEMRNDEDMAEMLEGLDIPELASYRTIAVQMDGDDPDFDVEVSDEMLQEMQDSDVTTIVETCKDMVVEMFGQVKPKLIDKATDGVNQGIEAMADGLSDMGDALSDMRSGMDEMDGKLEEMRSGMDEMAQAASGIQDGMDKMDGKLAEMEKGISGMNEAISGIKSGMDEMDGKLAGMEQGIADMDEAIAGVQAGIDELDGKIAEMTDGISGMDGAISDMQAALEAAKARGESEETIAEMSDALAETQGERDKMRAARDEMQGARGGMVDKRDEMQAARDEMQAGYEGMLAAREEMQGKHDELQAAREEMQGGREAMQSARDKMKGKRSKLKESRNKMQTGKKQMRAARTKMQQSYDDIQAGRTDMQTGYAEMMNARLEMEDAYQELKTAREDLADTIKKLKKVRLAIPGLFDEAEENYLAAVDETGPQIKEVYQATLNEGFAGLAFFVAACAVVGLLVLVPYRDKASRARKQYRESER